MGRKTWIAPRLIVLGRGSPQESTLAIVDVCKMWCDPHMKQGTPGNMFYDCEQVAGCLSCAIESQS